MGWCSGGGDLDMRGSVSLAPNSVKYLQGSKALLIYVVREGDEDKDKAYFR